MVPYAAPRTIFLQMIRKYRSKLPSLNIKEADIIRSVNKIELESQDSEVILTFCIPPAKQPL